MQRFVQDNLSVYVQNSESVFQFLNMLTFLTRDAAVTVTPNQTQLKKFGKARRGAPRASILLQDGVCVGWGGGGGGGKRYGSFTK